MFAPLQLSVFIFHILAVKFVYGANILYLCSLPSPSHQIWYTFCDTFFRFLPKTKQSDWIYDVLRNFALANGLAARGHNVTVISPDVAKNPPKGVHHIYLEGIYNDEWRAWQKHLFTYTDGLNPLTEPINYDNDWLGSCKGLRSIQLDNKFE